MKNDTTDISGPTAAEMKFLKGIKTRRERIRNEKENIEIN
jgi:hypothetical protein